MHCLPALQGARVCDMAERFGAKVVNLESGLGKSFSLEQLTAAVEEHKPSLLFLVQGESSTGVHQSLAGVGEWRGVGRWRGSEPGLSLALALHCVPAAHAAEAALPQYGICQLHSFACLTPQPSHTSHPDHSAGDMCRANGALLLVDTVCSLGGVPMYADAWGVDAIYSGSQKCLSAPPGASPVMMNERALAKIKGRKTKVSPVCSCSCSRLLWSALAMGMAGSRCGATNLRSAAASCCVPKTRLLKPAVCFPASPAPPALYHRAAGPVLLL